MSFFPPNTIGGTNSEAKAKRELRITLPFGDEVLTDIAGDKQIFRKRGWVRSLYEFRKAEPGDMVTLTWLAPYHLAIDVEKSPKGGPPTNESPFPTPIAPTMKAGSDTDEQKEVAGEDDRLDNGAQKGAGYEADPAIRSAVEKHAVRAARKFYEERGYSVEEKGMPYDLLCTKPGEVIHVEVKGSRTALEVVSVTVNEVGDARNLDWRSDLFLVDNIVIEPEGQGYKSSGGRSRWKCGWVPENKDLMPTQFRYKLPPMTDAG